MIVIIGALLYFVFAIGFNLLLNSAAFVAQFTNPKVTPLVQKNSDFIGTVSIDSIPNATNSAQFTVSGTAVNFNTVELYLNGEQVKSIKLDTSDGFTAQIGDLQTGTNEVYAVGIDTQNNQQKKTQVYTVEYLNQPPKLDVQSPPDHTKTNTNEIVVKGQTDKETYVRINDSPVVVGATGEFQYTVQLKEGDNSISVVAQDVAGNQTTKSLTVTYQKDQ